MKGGLNTYGYVGGNPLKYLDFLGLQSDAIDCPPCHLPPTSPIHDFIRDQLGWPDNRHNREGSVWEDLDGNVPDSVLDDVPPCDKGDKDKDPCSSDDDDYCYKRWEKENLACWQWKGLGLRVVQACQKRAEDRRNMCVANGGKPNPDEPPQYNPFLDYPR